MRSKPSDEFVLAKKPDGTHYEEIKAINDDAALGDAIRRAFAGRLDQHVPQPQERYSCRLYKRGPDRIIIKLTRRKR